MTLYFPPGSGNIPHIPPTHHIPHSRRQTGTGRASRNPTKRHKRLRQIQLSRLACWRRGGKHPRRGMLARTKALRLNRNRAGDRLNGRTSLSLPPFLRYKPAA